MPSKPSRGEQLSPVDHAWLRMEDPTNLMMVTGIMIFDQPLDFERLRATFEHRMLSHRRFRQRVVTSADGARWEDDPNFTLSAHLRRIALPAPHDQAALQELVSDMMSTPVDFSKSPWQYHLIENYNGGCVLLGRLHHCIADGIALIGVLLNLTDRDPNAPDTPRALPASKSKVRKFAKGGGGESGGLLAALGPLGEQLQGVLAPALHALAPVAGVAQQAIGQLGPLAAPIEHAIENAIEEGGRIGSAVVAKYNRWVDNPAEAVDAAKMVAGFAQELAWLATMPNDTPTSLKGTPGRQKCVAWSEPIDLARVKDVGYVLGCSVNDVLLASVAGAIRGHLLERGEDVGADALLRAFVPVNLRPPGKEYKLGNQFGLVGLELPIGEANPVARVFDVRRRMSALKNGYQAAVSMALLGVVGYLPKAVQGPALRLFSDKGTAVMTNVPGPAEPLYLAGCRIAQNMFWVPQSGNVGLGVSILSYAGGVQFGLITDRALCPDPQDIIRRFEPEFDKLLTALMWCKKGHVGADARAFDALWAMHGDHAERGAAAPRRAPIKARASTRAPRPQARKTSKSA